MVRDPVEVYIVILSMLSTVIAFAGGLYARRSLAVEMKVLLVYFGFSVLCECVLYYLAARGYNNLWLAHAFTIVEYWFLGWVFSSWLKNPLLRRILLTSIPLVTILGIVLMFYGEDVRHFNNFSRPAAGLLLVAASAYTLFELNQETFGSVFSQPRFWVSSAALLYFGSTLILFALSNTLLEFPDLLRKIFMFHAFVDFVANSLYTGGFLCTARKSGGR